MRSAIRPLVAITALALSVATLSSTAQADVYIGGGIYAPSLDGAKNKANSAAISTLEGNDSAVTPSIFLGWRPIEMVGVEAGYYDFGKTSQTVGGATAAIEAHAFTISGLVTLEIGPVGAYVKGGLAQSDVSLTAGGTTFDKSSADPFGGIGASIDMMDKLYLYVEHVIFTNDAKIGVSSTGLGLRYTL